MTPGIFTKLPSIDWARGQKPAWEKRMAESASARQVARGGVPDPGDPVHAPQITRDPNDPVYGGSGE